MTLPFFFEVPSLLGSSLLRKVVSSSLDSTLSFFWMNEQLFLQLI